MNEQNQGKFSLNIEDPNIPATISIPNYPSHSQPEPSPVSSLQKVQKYLKFLKWCLIPLTLIQLLCLIPKAYPLLFNLIFPILGLFGIIKLSPYFLKLFGIYLIILSLTQLISMIILKGALYITLQSLSLLLELSLSYISIKSGLLIESLSNQDFNQLKAT